jgi:hypothetical protein
MYTQKLRNKERLQNFLALGRNDEASFVPNQGLTWEVKNKGLVTHTRTQAQK